MKRVNEKDTPFKSGNSGSKYMFNEPGIAGGVAYLRPGDCINPHTHADETEIFYFIDGTPVFISGTDEIRVAEGDAFTVPAGETHGIRNDTQATVRLAFTKIKSGAK